MHVMTNRICYLEEPQWNCKLTAFRQYVYDQHFGIITVTIHPFDVPENGNAGNLIFRPPDENGVLRLKEVIRVIIIDGHRGDDIRKLRNDVNTEYEWT